MTAGFFTVYLRGECRGIPDGYRLLFAEIGRRRVKLLDPFTLDTGKIDLKLFERRSTPAKPGKGLIRMAIRRALKLRERTAMVKTCLASLKVPA